VTTSSITVMKDALPGPIDSSRIIFNRKFMNRQWMRITSQLRF